MYHGDARSYCSMRWLEHSLPDLAHASQKHARTRIARRRMKLAHTIITNHIRIQVARIYMHIILVRARALSNTYTYHAYDTPHAPHANVSQHVHTLLYDTCEP